MSALVRIHDIEVDPDHVIALVPYSGDAAGSYVRWELLMTTGDRLPVSTNLHNYKYVEKARQEILSALGRS